MAHALKIGTKTTIDVAPAQHFQARGTPAPRATDELLEHSYFSGNQARLRMLSEDNQPRGLRMGKLKDPQEAEAERAGSAVVRMNDSESSSRTQTQSKMNTFGAPKPNGIRVSGERAGRVTGDPAPPIVHEALRSQGRPLDDTTRAFMEPKFGQDFSQVRVRSGPLAERSARAVDARAYSVGNDIVLGTGQPSVQNPAVRETIAHELTHVAQQRSASNDAARVVRRQPTAQTAPSPTATTAHKPTVTPILLTDHDRENLKLATVGLIPVAFTNFVAACKAQADSIKAEDKAKNEMVAALVGVVFGLAAPVFSSWLMGAGAKGIANKLAAVLTTERARIAEEVVKGGDVLKESFKAVGAIATAAIKLNPNLLFGESDVDDFAIQLRTQFFTGVTALIKAVSSDALSDQALIATYLTYDDQFISELAYRDALQKIFDEFKSFVRPIGHDSFGNEATSTETTTGAVWVVGLGGKKELFLARKFQVLYPRTDGSLDSVTYRPVPDDVKSFVIAKTEREVGKVETIISPEELARLAAETRKPKPVVTPLPVVTPIPLEEAAATEGDWMAEKLEKNGLTPAVREEIQRHLEEYQGAAKEIFIAHLRKGWKGGKP